MGMIYKNSKNCKGRTMTVRVQQYGNVLSVTQEMKETKTITMIEPVTGNIELAKRKADEIIQDFINNNQDIY